MKRFKVLLFVAVFMVYIFSMTASAYACKDGPNNTGNDPGGYSDQANGGSHSDVNNDRNGTENGNGSNHQNNGGGDDTDDTDDNDGDDGSDNDSDNDTDTDDDSGDQDSDDSSDDNDSDSGSNHDHDNGSGVVPVPVPDTPSEDNPIVVPVTPDTPKGNLPETGGSSIFSTIFGLATIAAGLKFK